MSHTSSCDLPADLSPHRLLGKAEVAAMVGCHPMHLDRMIRAGRWPAGFRLGEGTRNLKWRASVVLEELRKREAAEPIPLEGVRARDARLARERKQTGAEAMQCA